jgi:hypothetical protein
MLGGPDTSVDDMEVCSFGSASEIQFVCSSKGELRRAYFRFMPTDLPPEFRLQTHGLAVKHLCTDGIPVGFPPLPPLH